MQGMQTLIVYHKGTHMSSLKPAVAQNSELITKVIQDYGELGSTGTVRRKLMKAVQQQASMGDVAKLA